MQNDRFAELFSAVAETDPETATEIALALFTVARETDKADAMFAVCDPDNATSAAGTYYSPCCCKPINPDPQL